MLRRLILGIFALTCMTLMAASQLTVGGHSAVFDELTSTYLCSIDESLWGQDFTASVVLDDHSGLKIDGTAVDGDYTFTAIDGSKKWTISATRSDGAVTRVYLQFTFLPVLEMTGTVEKDQYNLGQVIMHMPSEDITSPCRIKFRGSSTNRNDYAKRSYHLKFVDDAGTKVNYKFFDNCRNDNSWLLDAGTIDFLRVRNRVLTDLWLEINSRPYYDNLEPKALLGVRGNMVEVVRDGRYVGIFNMSEALDRKQLKLTKWDETTGDIHGQLWKEGQRSTTTLMLTLPTFVNTSAEWSGFETQYPDLDEVNPTDYSNLYNVVKLVARSNDSIFEQLIGQYIDLPVLIDMQVFNHVTLAFDNVGKNIYWATHDRTNGPMLTPIPWDFDTTLGQYWKATNYHPDELGPTADMWDGLSDKPVPDQYIKRLTMWNVNGFVDTVAARYRELRKGVLTYENIAQHFTSCIDMLHKSGAAEREEARWTSSTELGGQPVDLDTELEFVLDWIEKRLAWLDTVYFAPRTAGDVNTDGIVDITDVNAIINRVLGKSTIPEIYSYKLDLNNSKSIDITDGNAATNIVLKK